jgi:glucose-1-phosphate cytidylyltransferase
VYQWFSKESSGVKTVILAGGLGTRLQEETTVKPKPMVSVGGQPILWHILKIYASYGFDEFAIALGYKGDVIKDYFLNYRHRTSSLTVKLSTGDVTVHGGSCEDWTVHLLDTGLATKTGDRLRQAAHFIGAERLMMTYGDGVADVNVRSLLDFHERQGKLVTMTAVRPPARFGSLRFEGDLVAQFEEKPQLGEGWINGGFFVIEPEAIPYIAPNCMFEHEPLERLAAAGELAAYRHDGFWQCMDTLRDVRFLEGLWERGDAPWCIW